jgi:PPOX class probable FMN-dependent enzyme
MMGAMDTLPHATRPVAPAAAFPASAAEDPHAVTSLEQLAALYEAPRPLVLDKVTDRLGPATLGFLAASPFCLLSTRGSNGVHCTPRGDAPGFVEALDARTLALPDRRGNNRIEALKDIVETGEVALLFLVPGSGETLRVNGTARLTADPALRARYAVGGKEPATVMLVAVREVYMQCAKALMRSKLWDGRKKPEGLPSMGALLAEHTRGGVEPESYDAEAQARLVATMY